MKDGSEEDSSVEDGSEEDGSGEDSREEEDSREKQLFRTTLVLASRFCISAQGNWECGFLPSLGGSCRHTTLGVRKGSLQEPHPILWTPEDFSELLSPHCSSTMSCHFQLTSQPWGRALQKGPPLHTCPAPGYPGEGAAP